MNFQILVYMKIRKQRVGTEREGAEQEEEGGRKAGKRTSISNKSYRLHCAYYARLYISLLILSTVWVKHYVYSHPHFTTWGIRVREKINNLPTVTWPELVVDWFSSPDNLSRVCAIEHLPLTAPGCTIPICSWFLSLGKSKQGFTSSDNTFYYPQVVQWNERERRPKDTWN